MGLFKNTYESHQHSLKVLNLLREYDTFLESLSVIADMGCGCGLDTKWWAELTTRDTTPEPLNYLVYAVDKNIKKIEQDVLQLKNVTPIEGDFEDRIVPRQVDLMWAHDVLQYAKDPFKCLSTWKSTMNTNGMLILSIPQSTYIKDNRLVTVSYSGQYYNYNVLNLMYMLAASGFDCRDAYFYREQNSPWLYAAVYATQNKPFSERPTWFELADMKLVNESVINSLNKYGYVKLDEILVCWMDKENYFIKD